MKNQSLVFERIMWGYLRPWLDKNRQEEKFETAIGDLKIIEPISQPIYEIAFHRCFNCKTKYYKKLIVNEANNYCNTAIELINAHEDMRFKKYLLAGRLKKIKALLRLTGDLINANCYELQCIDPYKSDFDEGRDHKSDTYVIQLLKTALLKVYLEIQETFKSYVPKEDYMEIEDLYLQVLSDPIPEETFLKWRSIYENEESGDKTDQREKNNHTPAVIKSFRFDRYATNPGVLIDCMDALKLIPVIDNKSSASDFKKVFSGMEIGNPICWTGNDSEFYWFIYLIYTKYKFVDDLRQQQWKVAVHCFIRADGSRFDVSKLRNLKRPRRTGGLIEKAVRMMK